MNQSMKYRAAVALFLLMVVIVAGVGYLLGQKGPVEGFKKIGGEFVLQSVAGPVALSDFRGKVVLISFGYTFCPDVCPTSLAAITGALNQLAPEELAQVKTILVSVDPDRDTPKKLAEYVKFFHPSMVGLTGSHEEIARVAKQYVVLYRKVEDPEAGEYYSVDHSSTTFVIGRDSVVRSFVQHGATPDEFVSAIRTALLD